MVFPYHTSPRKPPFIAACSNPRLYNPQYGCLMDFPFYRLVHLPGIWKSSTFQDVRDMHEIVVLHLFIRASNIVMVRKAFP